MAPPPHCTQICLHTHSTEKSCPVVVGDAAQTSRKGSKPGTSEKGNAIPQGGRADTRTDRRTDKFTCLHRDSKPGPRGPKPAAVPLPAISMTKPENERDFRLYVRITFIVE